MNAAPLIVCPLSFERNGLARRGVRGRLICIGPGAAAVGRLAKESPTGPVVLAGVAGAVDEKSPAGSAYVISEVIGDEGVCLEPSWGYAGSVATARIATSHDVLITPQMKRQFAARTGAQLVDQESEPFARLASERGWTWGIVRGVSDDFSMPLPQDIHTWITAGGQTRFTRVIGSCLRRPKQIGSLLTIRRNSARALDAVAAILKAID